MAKCLFKFLRMQTSDCKTGVLGDFYKRSENLILFAVG